jgi:hypothetical protein
VLAILGLSFTAATSWSQRPSIEAVSPAGDG